MIKIDESDWHIKDIRLKDLKEFLMLNQWKLINHPNKDIQVFLAPVTTDDDKEVKLVIPTKESDDSSSSVKVAINVLSTILKRSPYEIILNIRSVNRDILQIEFFNNKELSFSFYQFDRFLSGILALLSICSNSITPPNIVLDWYFRCHFRENFSLLIESPLFDESSHKINPPFFRATLEIFHNELVSLLKETLSEKNNLWGIIHSEQPPFEIFDRGWPFDLKLLFHWSPQMLPIPDSEPLVFRKGVIPHAFQKERFPIDYEYEEALDFDREGIF